MEKKLFISEDSIRRITSLKGLCLASDKITVDGESIGYMYRERAQFKNDSGWRFLTGKETVEYLSDSQNIGTFDINTIANYDEAILQFLKVERGTAFIRNKNGKFVEDYKYDDDSPKKYFPTPDEADDEDDEYDDDKKPSLPAPAVAKTPDVKVDGAAYKKLSDTHKAALLTHISKNIGAVSNTVRDDEPEDVSVDIAVIPPSNGHDFYTLVTVGMSALEMEGANGDMPKRLELVMFLPADWQLDKNAKNGAPAGYTWPFAWLRKIGHMPFYYKSAISYGKVVPNGAPPKPIMQGSTICGIALDKIRILPSDVKTLTITPNANDGTEKFDINFLCLIPVYQAEIDLKNKSGADAMFNKIHETEFLQVLNPQRKCAIGGFSLDGIFKKK